MGQSPLNDVDLTARFYRSMRRIRRAEEEIVRLYPTDKIKSPVHLSIGQESVAVGVCEAVTPSDIAFGTYRGHALYLAKGGDLNAFMAELYGKANGCARGKAGSMHLVDVGAGMMGTSAIVATTIPLAVGYAMAIQAQKRDAVVLVMFGDGATDEGAYHESLNFAALRKLPILFVCENNEYAIYTHLQARMPAPNFCERAESYRIPATRVEHSPVFEVHRVVSAAVTAIRQGGGPQFIECTTSRWRDHVGPGEDRYLKYRDDAELDAWIARDEIPVLRQALPAQQADAIDEEIEAELAAAVAYAEDGEFPADSELYDHVYA